MTATTDPRDEDRPASLKTKALGLVLGLVALTGALGSLVIAGVIVDDLLIDRNGWDRGSAISTGVLAAYLLAGAIGAWGFRRLKPWLVEDPISPAMRRTNTLFGLSGVVVMPGMLALVVGTTSAQDPLALFSNSPVAVWIALVAIASWLLSMAIGWWWYFSADEHERTAYDIGSVAGAGFFTVAAPTWWIAARGGLAPPPDAMILWGVTMMVISIVWFWRRYR